MPAAVPAAASGGRSQRIFGVLAAVLCVLLGIAIATQVRQTRSGDALTNARPADLLVLLDSLQQREAALNTEVSELQRKLVAQTRSFEEILGLARNSSKLAESIPAIQPVRNRDLRALASGWGYRIHPIYKVRKFHYGMDFSAKTGTEVFATGDGVVVAAEQKYDGYGLHVVIRHGYGYQTLYAHMSKLAVRSGQRVKRGEVIGFVGSTGTSVAPHLHYEVIKDGEKVNPAHYYFNDLTPAQYEQILKMSDAANQSFD
jgi:murein DD-endopeptidase MepM/ murein hydrolase activator NlpD